MSVARRVSWWALLAMVFLVPIAISNLTFLGFQTALHLRPVRHRQGVSRTRARARRAGRLGLGHAAPRRPHTAHAGRLAHPRLPRLGGAHHGHVHPLADGAVRQAAALRRAALLRQLRRHLLPRPAVRRPRVAGPPSGPVAVLGERDRRRLRCFCSSPAWSSCAGARCRSRPTAPSPPTATPTFSAAS